MNRWKEIEIKEEDTWLWRRQFFVEPQGELTLFKCRCGFEWAGDGAGDWTCPECGAHDGDHHLKKMKVVPIFRNYI